MSSPFLMIRLLSAVYWFDEALQESLRVSGQQPVSRAQSLLLANLAVGEHRAARLARNLGVTRQAISQTISELESRGVVTTETDPEDGRARIVEFSDQAAPLRRAAQQILTELEQILEKRAGARNFRALYAALDADWGEPPTIDVAARTGRG